QDKLDTFAPGRYMCYQGLKHARPYIEDGVANMAADGVREAVGIVLAPHYSIMSVGGYVERARKKAEELGIEMNFVESYHMHPKLLEALISRVKTGLGPFDASRPVKVLFSAHSLPVRIREINDPYEAQLLETSAAVAEGAGASDWSFTW
ncbi:ferrochelatase, partial [Paenibacillus sepulcri]|nr:ferrochelatase [Paenibacillus sepulcri]